MSDHTNQAKTTEPMPTKKPTKKPTKRGRPKGSKTLDLPVVAVRPAQCPRCKSSQRTKKRSQTRHVRKPILTHQAGQTLRTTWSTVTCKSCGQPYRIRSTEVITSK